MITMGILSGAISLRLFSVSMAVRLVRNVEIGLLRLCASKLPLNRMYIPPIQAVMLIDFPLKFTSSQVICKQLIYTGGLCAPKERL